MNVFGSETFKIQSVGGIKVGRYRFGIVVDYDNFVAEPLERPYAVYGRIVKLYALTYPYGTRAYYDYSLLFVLAARRDVGQSFIVLLFVISGVEIGRLRRKFRAAGIDHFECGIDMPGQGIARNFGKRLIGVSQLFSLQIVGFAQLSAGNCRLIVGEIFELIEEPLVYLRYRINLVYVESALYCLIDDKQSFIGELVQLFAYLAVGQFLHFGHIECVQGNFGAAHSLHYSHFKACAYRHDFAGSLHARAQSALCIQEFIERPLGKFDYHVVQSGFEAGISFACDVVLYFIESVAQSYLCRHLGYGIARSL